MQAHILAAFLTNIKKIKEGAIQIICNIYKLKSVWKAEKVRESVWKDKKVRESVWKATKVL